jgi:formamidopyrimidine-DNA glycosylase
MKFKQLIMPELPEVETVLRALKPHLINDSFTAIKTYVGKLRTPLDIADRPELLHQKITNLWRRAKYIILELENDYGLLMHLGMTGSWRLESPFIERLKHDHVEFYLSSGLVLRYNDPRRFGQIMVIESINIITKYILLSKLGPEPLTNDFNINYMKNICRGKKKPMKSLLMDNAMVVGVGNIYASESLFHAGINPLLPAGSISRQRLQRLVTAIKNVLKTAIDAGGTTIKDYASLNGEEGNFDRELKVYGKTGEKCNKCGRGIIRQTYLSGRSTFYCPVCQR